MNDPIECNVTQDDVVRGARRYCKTAKTFAPARRNQLLIAMLALAMLAAPAAALLIGSVEHMAGSAFVIALILVVFIISQMPPGRALANNAETNFRAHDGRLMLGPTRLSWCEGGMLVESRYVATLYRPGSIHGVSVGDEDVIIERPDRSVLVIPMRAFAGAPEARAFADTIRDRLVEPPASAAPDASATLDRPAYPSAPPTSPGPAHPPTTPAS